MPSRFFFAIALATARVRNISLPVERQVPSSVWVTAGLRCSVLIALSPGPL